MPRLLWPLLMALLLGACASTPNGLPERSEAAQYQEAREAMEAKNFNTAINRLKELEARFPYGVYARQAQLDLIYSQFRTTSYPETVAAASSYISSYPASPHLDYALYMRGLANFYMNQGLFSSLLSTGPAARDLSSARAAFEDFERLVTRFPDSQYAPDARSRMVYIRNLLSAHEIHVARYYARRGAYIAAINRAQYVVQHYQRTPQVPEALAIMAEGYKRLGEAELATKSRKVLKASWPDTDYLNDEGRITLAWWPDEQNGLLDLLTFDLL